MNSKTSLTHLRLWLSLCFTLVSSWAWQLGLSLPHGWHDWEIHSYHLLTSWRSCLCRVCVKRQRRDREPSGDARRLINAADGTKSVVQLLLNLAMVKRNNAFSQEEWHLDTHSPSIVYECLDPEVLQENNQNSSDVLWTALSTGAAQAFIAIQHRCFISHHTRRAKRSWSE